MRGLRRHGAWGVLVLGSLVAAAGAAVLYQGRAVPPPDPQDEAAFIAHLRRRVPALMRRYSVPGVGILVIRHGETVWTAAFGHADVDRNSPLRIDSPMMAHSISKSVAAWGVMMLVQEGRIGLDDPVSEHIRSWRLPESPYGEAGVTIRRLLSNSAGIPLGTIGVHYAPGTPVPPLADLLAGPEVALMRVPGTAFSYSNSGFAILELLIQEVTGRDFAEFMEEEVLLPLGMAHSTFAWRDELRAVPSGYDLRGRPVPVYLYPARASGGLFTTLQDLGRFASATAADHHSTVSSAVLGGAIRAELYRPQVEVSGLFRFVSPSYGLGHFVEPQPNGRTAVWHGGQGLGWMTHFHAIPERGDAIVLLTNSQRSWPLMAHVLNAWARWTGAGSVGMGRIARAETVTWWVIAGIFLTALSWVAHAAQQVAGGRRRFVATRLPRSPVQLAQIFAGAALLGGLLWAAAQDYLFISSVLPRSTTWLGAALAALALALVTSGLLSPRSTGAGSDPLPPP
jgi:CubicO group peptidase (beta-lactamase class C family)